MIKWTIFQHEAQYTALEILQARLPDVPLGFFRQLFKKGRVRNECGPLNEYARLQAGEFLFLPSSQRLVELIDQAALPPGDILWETDQLLVAYKPSGLATHPTDTTTDSLLERVQRHIKQCAAPYRVAPAHRLDLDTSGPVLFGKGRKATAALGKLFMARQIDKRYLALVPSGLSETGRLTTNVLAKGKEKPATATFTRLATNGRQDLLDIDLVTGRTHQLRQQLAEEGHPIAGDRRYHGPCLPGLGRAFLHCWQLSFPVDQGGGPQTIKILCPLPGELETLLTNIGINAEVALSN